MELCALFLDAEFVNLMLTQIQTNVNLNRYLCDLHPVINTEWITIPWLQMNSNFKHIYIYTQQIYHTFQSHVKHYKLKVYTFIHPLLILCLFVYWGFHYICRMLKARKVITINNCLSNIKPNKIDKKDSNFLFFPFVQSQFHEQAWLLIHLKETPDQSEAG